MKTMILFLTTAVSLMLCSPNSFAQTSPVTTDQINEAMVAENSLPSAEVNIRESGPVSQYEALDNPKMYGKKVLVNFFTDRFQPGSNASRYPVPQLVLTKDYLDPESQNLVTTIKRESLKSDGTFREVGAWIIFTDRGAYKSNTFTSNDAFVIENDPVLKGFEEAFKRAQQAEGAAVQIADLEFYHTHLERGEAFSFSDLDFQERYYLKTYKKLIRTGGTYSSHAVPIKGQALFRNSIRRTP
jgi:hypothetical protein